MSSEAINPVEVLFEDRPPPYEEVAWPCSGAIRKPEPSFWGRLYALGEGFPRKWDQNREVEWVRGYPPGR